MQLTPQLLTLAFSGVILITLAVFVLGTRKTMAVPFGILMLLAAGWCVSFALEIGSVDLAAKILWRKIAIIPVALIPVQWLVLTFHYTGRGDWLTPGRLAVLFAAPLAAIVLGFMSGGGETAFLFDFHLEPSGRIQAVQFSHGALYVVYVICMYCILAFSVFLILSSARSRPALFKRQSWLMVLGILAPMVADALYQLGIASWEGIDLAPVATLVSGACAWVALYRYQWLDVFPIANSLVMQTLDDILLVLDTRDRLIEFNPRARSVIGFAPLSAMGKPVGALPPPWAAALAPYAGRISARGRIDIGGRDGARVYELTLSPIRNRLGKPSGRLLILHDVTERALAEEELRVSRERLQLAFDSASDGLWDWEVPTGRMYWSPRFYTMLGYQPGEIEAGEQSWNRLIHTEDVERIRREIDSILCGRRESFSIECRLQARDGGWRWVLSRGRVLSRGEDGGTAHIVGTNVDITETMEVEQRLRESEEKFRSFIEQAQDAIMLIDGEGRIAEYNPAAEKLSGVRRGDAIGTYIWDFSERTMPLEGWTAEYKTHLMERYLAALRNGEGDFLGHTVEGVLTQPNGGNRSFQQILFPIRTKSGWLIGSISHDVTEITKTEAALRKSREQLLQAQKMEAVGRLAGGIAHDFNNILTVISGYGDAVMEGLSEDSPLREDMSEVLMAARRASTLTSQLLAFSRKQVLQPKVINVNDLVRAMGNMLRRLIGEDIVLATSLAPDAGNIKADPGQIEQVLMNLVVNSRDAMPEGGTLTLSTSNTIIGDEHVKERPEMKQGEYVALCVSDTGQGMDAETLPLIFEPFFTTKGTGKGTGLGLPTAYGIVKQSGGYIYCESEPGKGTKFTLYFPRCALEKTTEAAEPAIVKARKGTETILLVEDEDSVRSFTADVLKKGGYKVLAVPNGRSALKEIKAHPGRIQFLLTDVVMPKMNGMQLAQEVKKLFPGIRILYVSGYVQEAVENRGTIPAADFIQKPFTSEALLGKIREILDR